MYPEELLARLNKLYTLSARYPAFQWHECITKVPTVLKLEADTLNQRFVGLMAIQLDGYPSIDWPQVINVVPELLL